MSSKMKIALVAGALIAVGALAAVSQTSGQRREHDRSGYDGDRWMRHGFGSGRPLTKDAFDTRTRERFARLDRNNDGVIEAAEVEAVTAARIKDAKDGRGGHMREHLERQFDDNRDGKVSRDEYLASVKRRFADLDLDRDGRITDADLPPMMRGRMALAGQDFAEEKGRSRDHRGPLAMLRGADANNDGVITWEEASAAAELRFARLDRTKDGIIDAADAEALRTEIVDYRVKRVLHHHGAGVNGKVTREQFSAKANERFARLDRDNDGVISRAERPGRGHGWHKDRGVRHGEFGPHGRGADAADPSADRPKGPGTR